MAITIISFGYLHGPTPAADFAQDLRSFRDPHVDPAMRQLTGRDQAVITKVLGTPGVPAVINTLALACAARSGYGDRPVTAAVGCAGGRHRSVVVINTVARLLREQGYDVTVQHRDLARPVVTR
ncbi:RapZ C-terminal domain-containing protein [Actinacidiphila yeochonensis]|uniref:RapZ C-terminal domain-containing protein n=1 Tax=Actinacidiphila yeochonensis TaxID=89050 RepID=UPI000568B35F|nr:RNase adapter RapZ [Actinacidiphila yeochonensis]